VLILNLGDSLAVEVVGVIQQGNTDLLIHLLRNHPHLATAAIKDPNPICGVTRTLLHILTDWPGHFPNGAQTTRLFLDAGADVNARCVGSHSETPLHWAASSDDVEVLEVLIDAGADIEADGGVIGNGTPLADAVAFGQWKAAFRLVERGARTTLWQAAALGMVDEVERHRKANPAPSHDELTNAFWCACHGGQRKTAERLLIAGAELNWIGYDGLTPLDAARRSNADEVARWLLEQGAVSSQ